MRTLSPSTDKEHYRPELDGLRAVAILLVVLYHLGSPLAPGGFVGVDVFFVLSGFLITQNIRRQNQLEEWSYRRFYTRRIRRLFPALLVTVASTWAFAGLLFGPELFQATSASAIASLASVSNFNFWMSAGYFDTSQLLKPLLHTWSLSIEEQFYLIWPVLILTITRTQRPRMQIAILTLISLVSIALAEAFLDSDPSAAFYLMPARIFEFGIGALCVWAVERGVSSRPIAEGLVSSGLLLILFSALSLSEAHRFPGTSALAPCIGTALCIIGGEKACGIGRLLRNRLAVGLGLLSYSLYLVHWPVIVFYSYWQLRPLTSIDRLGLSTLSLVAALALFYGVEQRFRFAPAVSNDDHESRFTNALLPARRPSFLAGCGALTILLCVPFTLAWRSDGWPQRIGASIAETPGKIEPRKEAGEYGGFVGALKTERAEILLIGDSHAKHLASGLDPLGKAEHWKIQLFSSSSCQPVVGSTKIFPPRNTEKQKSCEQYLSELEQLLASRRYPVVAIAGRWEALLAPKYFFNGLTPGSFLIDSESQERSLENSREVFPRRMGEMVERLVAAGSRVILVGQAPSYVSNPSNCLRVPTFLFSRSHLERRCQVPEYPVLMGRLQIANKVFNELAGAHKDSVKSLLLSEILCDSEASHCRVLEKGVPLYRDANHLSPAGSRYVIQKSAPLFRSLLANSHRVAKAETAMHP